MAEKTQEELEAEATALAEEEAGAAELAEAEALALAEEQEAEELEAKLAAERGKPVKKTFQERINELTWKHRQSERDVEYWKGKALEKGKPAGEKGAVSDDSVTDSFKEPRPKATAFETVEAYEDALHDWYDSKKVSKSGKEKKASDFKEAIGTFNKGAASVRIEHPDFDEVVNRPVFTESMRMAVFTIDNGAMVAYALGKDPAEADRIKALSPEKQVYEVGKLERKLLQAQKGKKKSNTPDPLDPITGLKKGKVDPDKMGIKDWMAYDNARRMAKIKAKYEGK